MYQSVPSTFGISLMSGASRWLDAAARGGVIVSAAPTSAIASIIVVTRPAILLAFSIGHLSDLRTVVPSRPARALAMRQRLRVITPLICEVPAKLMPPDDDWNRACR